MLALLAAGCARPAPPPAARTLVDGLGRTVHLPAEVHRVIALAPSSTEILYAVGAGPLVVGVDRYSDWPPAARTLTHVGADVDPSLEKIAALHPDIVFTATSANNQKTAESLDRIGIPVWVSRADTIAEIYADVRGIASAVGRTEAGVIMSDKMRADLAALERRFAAQPAVGTMVVVWPEPLMVAGNAGHVGELVRMAGGRNLADDSSQAFPTYSLERLLARAPAVLIVGSHADAPPPLAPLERLTTLPAVRDHRIFLVDGDLLFRPGPRVVDGVAALGKLLHPDL